MNDIWKVKFRELVLKITECSPFDYLHLQRLLLLLRLYIMKDMKFGSKPTTLINLFVYLIK